MATTIEYHVGEVDKEVIVTETFAYISKEWKHLPESSYDALIKLHRADGKNNPIAIRVDHIDAYYKSEG